MRSFSRWRGRSKVGRIFFRGYQRCGLVGPKNVKLSFWESTKPLVAHPEPHRPLARGGAGFGTLAACTRLPGGHRAKTLTPLSMPAYPAFLLPTPFPKEFRLLSAFFPRSQPPRNGPSFPRKKFRPRVHPPLSPKAILASEGSTPRFFRTAPSNTMALGLCHVSEGRAPHARNLGITLN